MATWVQDVTKERIAFCHMVSETPVRAPLGQYSNYLLQIHCSEFIVITKSNPKPFFPIVQSVFGTWVLYTKLIWGPCRYFLASTAMPINHTLTKL